MQCFLHILLKFRFCVSGVGGDRESALGHFAGDIDAATARTAFQVISFQRGACVGVRDPGLYRCA